MGVSSQLRLLLWKHVVLQKHLYPWTILQLAVPITIALIIGFVRDLRSPIISLEKEFKGTEVYPMDINNVCGLYCSDKMKMYFVPETYITFSIMKKVKEKYDGRKEMVIVGNMSNKMTEDTLGTVTFTDGFRVSINKDINYKLKVNNPRNRSLAYSSMEEVNYSQQEYLHKRYNSLKAAIDVSIIEIIKGENISNTIKLKTQPFIQPSMKEDPLLDLIGKWVPLVIVISLTMFVASITLELTLEKENNLKHSLKMIGISRSVNLVAHLIKNITLVVIIMLTLTTAYIGPLDIAAVFERTNSSIILVLFMMYGIDTVLFAAMVAVFFNKAKYATLASILLFVVSYFPDFYAQRHYTMLNLTEKLLLCVFHNVALSRGVRLIVMHEKQGIGVKWKTLNQPIGFGDTFTLLEVFAMLVADGLLYGSIAFLLEKRIPQFSLPKYFYFFIRRPFRCGETDNTDVEEDSDTLDPEFFEDNIKKANICYHIRGLEKVYETAPCYCTDEYVKKHALRNVNVDFYANQITAILGNNGCGKTTLLSIMSGLIRPSNGFVVINDCNVNTSPDVPPGGICPHGNLVFPDLTVMENLTFFAKLKNSGDTWCHLKVEDMIKSLDLTKKTHEIARNLSRTMQKLLSIGNALISDSQIILLDNPTAEVDLDKRRHIWEILAQNKKGRTIIFTTHDMEEADFLADRIAIMTQGAIKCCGTSTFLKNVYGLGYYLTMEKLPGCIENRVTETVFRYLDSATLDRNFENTLAYSISKESPSSLKELFTNLETHARSLCVRKFGVAVTPMEEVFMKVAKVHIEKEKRSKKGDGHNSDPSRRGSMPENDYQLIIKTLPECNRDTVLKVVFNFIEDAAIISNSSHGITFSMLKVSPLVMSKLVEHLDKYAEALAVWKFGVFNKKGGKVVFGKNKADDIWFDPFGDDPPLIEVMKRGCTLVRTQSHAMFFKLRAILSRNHVIFTVMGFILFIFLVIQYYGDLDLKDTHESNKEVIAADIDLYSKTFLFPLIVQDANDTGKPWRNILLKILNNMTDNIVPLLDEELAADYIHTLYDTKRRQFHDSLICGLYIGGDTLLGYHSITAPFAPQIALSLMTNILLKDIAGPDYHITTHTPIVSGLEPESQIPMFGLVNSFGFTVAIGLIILHTIKERIDHSKRRQISSGIGRCMFWMTKFLYEFMIVIGLALVALFFGLIFSTWDDNMQIEGNIRHLLLPLVVIVYGWAFLPLLYLMSFLFTQPSAGFLVVSMGQFIMGYTGQVILHEVFQKEEEPMIDLWQKIFIAVSPNFWFVTALSDLQRNDMSIELCPVSSCSAGRVEGVVKNTPCCPQDCTWRCAVAEDWYSFVSPGIGKPLALLAIQGLIYLYMLFIVESGLFSRRQILEVIQSHWVKRSEEEKHIPDVDVRVEEMNINVCPIEHLMEIDQVLFLGLKKYYRKGPALKGITLGVPTGQCLGLLGVNNSGKSSLLKMVTGQIPIIHGDAYVHGYNCRSELSEVKKKSGYCPQYHALSGDMNCQETLVFYSRIRGLGTKKGMVDKIMYYLHMEEYRNVLVKNLSDGNKRKLAIGIALMGEPPVIFLDEPTSGLDPAARNQVFNILSKLKKDGETLILASESLDECKAVCDRIAIMASGEIHYLGTLHHLRERFGKGYTLMLKLDTEPSHKLKIRTDKLKEFIAQTIPESVLSDQLNHLFHYVITPKYPSRVTWVTLFEVIEDASVLYSIVDFSIEPHTLKQFYAKFSKEAATGTGLERRDTGLDDTEHHPTYTVTPYHKVNISSPV